MKYANGFLRENNCVICGEIFQVRNPRHIYCGDMKDKSSCIYKRRLELGRKHWRIRKEKGYYQTEVMRKKLREAKKKYKDSHPDYVKKQLTANRKYWRDNKEEMKKMNKKWRKNNLDLVLFSNRKRMLKLKGVEGCHTIKEWKELKSKYNLFGRYGISEDQLKEKWEVINKGFIKLTKDHIVPISKKGTDYIKNIQPLCVSCNSKKRDKI